MTDGNKKVPSRRVVLGAGILFIIVASIAATILLTGRNDQGESTTVISERIIKKVQALYVVPLNEAPTVAEIKDRSSLQGNDEFYANAQNGDYVLVYPQSKTAFLYRESINKLVKVSPVSMPAPADQTSR